MSDLLDKLLDREVAHLKEIAELQAKIAKLEAVLDRLGDDTVMDTVDERFYDDEIFADREARIEYARTRGKPEKTDE